MLSFLVLINRLLIISRIWIITFVDSMQQTMGFQLSPYVTSSFALHSLTATTGIVSGIVGGLVKLPLAKMLDIWGRPQGFLLMDAFLILGLIMMAACNNVETYAAAQVFYWIGLAFPQSRLSQLLTSADTTESHTRCPSSSQIRPISRTEPSCSR